MAPIRRYLRITKFSVLEVRIYLGWPSDIGWLLNERNPALPRVIEAVRPLVIPKLEEEKARSLSKSKKARKPTKDRIVEDDFEVSVFLTDNPFSHHILVKQKDFRDKSKPKIKSNSSKLTGGESNAPIDLEQGPQILEEEDSDDALELLRSLPNVTGDDSAKSRSNKRARENPAIEDWEMSEDDGSDSGLFVPEDAPTSKRSRTTDALSDGPANDDKKKMLMDTTYEGFSIYGKALYLIVTRKDTNRAKANAAGRSRGAKLMEDYISSTQMPVLDA